MIADSEQTNTFNRSEALRNALQAAEAGRAVFPLYHKKPVTGATPRGHLDASRDPSKIHALFNRAGHRATGYGIRTGSVSGVVVVDVDSAEGVAEVRRMGLSTGYIVRSGRMDGNGWHLYFTVPSGVEVKGGPFGEHLRLQGDGQFVCGPGSLHPSGQSYEVVRSREPSPAPPEILAQVEKAREKTRTTDKVRGPISIDLSGPRIVEGQPGRNLELTSICGRLHDSTRDLSALTRDLLAINEARCDPPLPAAEVEGIARKIYRREHCKLPVSDKVRAAVRYLRQAAEERHVRDRAGGSAWSIYSAGLAALEKWGREHEAGITLRLDCRTWAQMSGKDAATVSRFVRRSPMVRMLRKGSGRRPMTVLFRVPPRVLETGGDVQHSSPRGFSQERATPGSVAHRPPFDEALFRTLYRSRWSKRSRKSRAGLAPDTRKVRQSRTPPSEGIRRMGPTRAALLWKIHQNPSAKRSELAAMLGLKPSSLKKPLQMLREKGMIVRTGHGRYEAVPDLERRVEDARSLGSEPEADREQIIRHNIQRTAYRNRGKAEQKSEPSPESVENIARSRAQRDTHLRQQAERERQEREKPQTAEEERGQRQRIKRMVEEGWSYHFARTEVLAYGHALMCGCELCRQ
jgi:biotin operon repressor